MLTSFQSDAIETMILKGKSVDEIIKETKLLRKDIIDLMTTRRLDEKLLEKKTGRTKVKTAKCPPVIYHKKTEFVKIEQKPLEPIKEKLKRLTIDIPASLHKLIKVSCAEKGIKMSDDVRMILEQRFNQ